MLTQLWNFYLPNLKWYLFLCSEVKAYVLFELLLQVQNVIIIHSSDYSLLEAQTKCFASDLIKIKNFHQNSHDSENATDIQLCSWEDSSCQSGQTSKN